ncbi:MAG: 1-acyl-sn-glycerol-3-phosphate acyltransferase [Candidatus Obscuribacterales bacterium]|nr:1-acyl-sn-glycerol-3-phosphate acyltransferase [Candidatus Obscuribacterales bacterium]
MFNKFLSYIYIAYFFISSAFLVWISAALCLLVKGRDPNRRLVHMYSCWWGYHYIAVNPFWQVSFEGLEHIDPSQTYVLAANHQSFWDIMVLYGLNKPYKWVSKESIFKIPFIGWNMTFNQYVKIARGDLKSIKEMMNTCKNWLKQGASIMIFPEGTRSPDGEIKEFRDGPFKMASDCNVAVVPIVVDGTGQMLPKGTMYLNFKGKAQVRVLPPVHPQDFGGNVKKFRDHVRELMVQNLAEMRGGNKSLDETESSNSAAALSRH